jgi:DNA-binding response OmpR family regulator
MEAPIIVWVGEAKTALFSTVEKKYTTYLARSGKRGLELAQSHHANLFILDAASLKTSGSRIAAAVHAAMPALDVLLILPPERAQATGRERVVPADMTTRRFIKLLNRLLNGTADDTIVCGDFMLNVNRRMLTVRGQERPVNPKQARLLEMFFRHPNTVLDRAQLMKDIWQTDYLGDTRTLNVHIRWLREALEGKKGEHGHYITTVRGVGYRLDVAEPVN